MPNRFKKVFVIINPALGRSNPILQTLHQHFSEAGIVWDVGITTGSNMTRLVNQAVYFGAELVAVYGGDGTIADAVKSLVDKSLPLAILPGGTANVLATELGLPRDFVKAVRMITQRAFQFRAVDVGCVNDRHFLLRVEAGIEAEAVVKASRKLKKDLGPLAYAVSAVGTVLGTRVIDFELTLDGETIHTEGLSCVVANSGNLGLPNVSLSPTDMSDGFLDVFVIRDRKLDSLFAVATNILTKVNHESLQHWRVREVRLKSTPQKVVHYDGEILGPKEFHARVLHRAVNILSPGR